MTTQNHEQIYVVAIHNKNGQGLLRQGELSNLEFTKVAIHNKNGQGLLQKLYIITSFLKVMSQSTIKMDKGYYK